MIFYLTSSQAEIQDIRELEFILNLMPKKIETELHLLRMLSNSPFKPTLNYSNRRQSKQKHPYVAYGDLLQKLLTPSKTAILTA